MKHFSSNLVAGLTALLLLLGACGDSKNATGQNASDLQSSLTLSNSNTRTKVVGVAGESFFLKVTAPAQWSIILSPAAASEWISLDTKSGGRADALGVSVTASVNTSTQREALIILKAGSAADTIRLIQQPAVTKEPDNGSNGSDNGGSGDNGGNSGSDDTGSGNNSGDTGQGNNNPDGNDNNPGGSDNGSGGSNNGTDDNNGGDNNTGGGDSNTDGGSGNTGGTGSGTVIPPGEHILGDPTRIEIPALAGGTHNYFVTHKTSDGVVNYSLEYDTQRYHSRWVAFTFDDVTAARNYTTRTDKWAWDPIIPSTYSTNNWFSRTGYSRGHLVASSDRYYSRQANEQTFYYSNMSPQLQDHNGGIWNNLEQLVQNWGRNSAFRDVMYVVKGGTIKDGQIETERIRSKMVIPKYYYMAIVVQKGSNYQGIAFWTEHRKYPKVALKTLTMSIDELERLTGIDFFPNLPDNIENRVEAQTADSHAWPGL